jgi:predicted RNA-binding protein YlqC (UPF0109 family)
MKELVEVIAKSLVDHPEEIEVREVEGDHSVVYELSVHPDDTGRIIGKQGRIVKAFRTVVAAAAVKENKKVMVEIV